ncbi:uncharacterized protein LOC115694037 isoform X1 [Syzygium oleosum]|uniref:uncharacterized protein LOC115694037 isoform X1 n=1 Tax=Syzygium oleosum TaxID=219896 RepID=UPI0024B940BC|nr:uncharacterized protein LOC115694037 isoform X1 [Syzygium oleosum]
MFPNKKHSKRRPRAAAQSPPSPPRAAPIAAAAALPSSHRPFTPSTSLIDQELETLQDTSSFLLQSLQISLDEAATAPPSPNPNPRSFPYVVKQQCWDKAEKVKGRDPDRWRRDAVGNIVFRKLVGCPGCLCHDYDHIVPYSKVKQRDVSRTLLYLRCVLFWKINLPNEATATSGPLWLSFILRTSFSVENVGRCLCWPPFFPPTIGYAIATF